MVVTRIAKAKLLPTALIITLLIAMPTATSVYAQTADETQDKTTTKATNNKETLVVNNQEPTPSVEPTVELVENEELTPSETPTSSPELTAVTLAQAQVIAETEHPESVVVASKTKTMNGVTVHKFTFDDGWKVYVRASDGTVIKVQDKKDRDHDCMNRHKHSSGHVWHSHDKSDASATSARSERGDSHWQRTSDDRKFDRYYR